MVFKFIFISFALLFQMSSYGAETDQFTRRDEFLSDSAELINFKANQSILSAIKVANEKHVGCAEEDLYKELRKYFANHISGKFTIDVLNDSNVEKRMVSVEDSVYRDWKVWDGIGIGLKALTESTISGVVRVGDKSVGVDKFEHMFGQGFDYFTTNYLERKGPLKAMKMGIFLEKFLLGGLKLENGIFSYGDLSANFNGMRMWNHMLQLRPDVLGDDFNIGPYIVCRGNGHWEQVKKIDFRNYIDDAMDESINCSKFASQKTADKFTDRLSLMGMTCPMDKVRLDRAAIKYGEFAKWLINKDGSGKIKYFGEFKNK
jgi:hypothetical protein